jgi:hypothetical protein
MLREGYSARAEESFAQDDCHGMLLKVVAEIELV